MEKYPKATALLEDYTRDPRRYWGKQGGAQRQSRKLDMCLRLQSDLLDADTGTVLSRAVSIASERAEKRPPPIYVMGVGGSGSHWLAGMLAQLFRAIDVGEVHIPDGLREQMRSLPAEEQGFLVDCLHLIHCVLVPPHKSLSPANMESFRKARMVNPADGAIHPDLRNWDPECCVIHLLRDPRDRVMSVTFRKQDFRQAQYPEMSDEQYLLHQARTTAVNFAAWQSASLAPDFLCLYEKLRASTADVLAQIAERLGEPVGAERVAQVAREHDASLIRSGEAPSKANLFPRPSPGWRQETDERQRALLHSLLTEVVTRADYPADDCLGSPLEMTVPGSARRLGFPEDRELGALFTREASSAGETPAWRPFADARGEVTVLRGVNVKLRVHEKAAPDAIASLVTLPPDGLDSLCLASIRNVDDELLATVLASLAGIQELDLSRTSATDRALSTLAALPKLRGVNLLAVGSPQGVASLREASPSLRIVSDEVDGKAQAKSAGAERQ